MKKILSILLLTLFFVGMITLASPEAHILIIGDSRSDVPLAYNLAKSVANQLKKEGYDVLELYQSNATTKNIMKGMYNADAVIYLGHGGYQSGHYDGNGGVATPPFAIVGSNDFIWGIGDKMREGWDGNLFKAPFKSNIPVIIYACLSTGRVEDKEVANPIETIYNFSRMFTSTGANYYATLWLNTTNIDIIDEFLGGSPNFKDAVDKSPEAITKSTVYNGVTIWRNDHGKSAFVGNWYGKFPTITQTTPYDDKAAESWYNNVKYPIKVISFDPVNYAVNVGVTKIIKITFNKPIKALSNWIELKNSKGTIIPISKSFNSNILTINHNTPFSKGTKYTLIMHSSSVSDLAGNPIGLTSTSFTTDGTPPKITAIDPINNAINVPVNKIIKISFNEPIKFQSKWIELKNSKGTIIPISKSINGKTLTINHNTPLSKRTKYTLIIHSNSITDLAGNPIGSKSTSFNTTKV